MSTTMTNDRGDGRYLLASRKGRAAWTGHEHGGLSSGRSGRSLPFYLCEDPHEANHEETDLEQRTCGSVTLALPLQTATNR